MSVAQELSRAAVERLKRLVRVSYAELGEQTGTAASTVSGFMNFRQPNWSIGTFVRLATAVRHDVGIVLIPHGEPYRFCGEQRCAGSHYFLDLRHGDGQGWCHGAPIR